jgi:NADH dehydrogenase FAD-containing subunit
VCQEGVYIQNSNNEQEKDNLQKLDCIIWAGSPAPCPFNYESNLDLNKEGYIIVNEYLQPEKYKNIFAIGDCITLDEFDNKIPKAGVHAVLQSMLIAKNLKLKITKNSDEDKLLFKFIPKPRLQIMTTGDNQAFAVKNNKIYFGKSAFYLKKILDWNFMHRFQLQPFQDWKYRLFKVFKILSFVTFGSILVYLLKYKSKF